MKKVVIITTLMALVMCNVGLARVHSDKCDQPLDEYAEEADYSDCGFNNDDLANVLSVNKEFNQHIVSINLSNNNISAAGIKTIIDYIKQRQQGQSLFQLRLILSNNHIGDEGAKFLANSLSNLEVKYISLGVENNYITTDGMLAIATIPHLDYLSAGYNDLQPEAISAFLKNENLTYLRLQQATFNENNIQEMAKNTKIKSYDFSYSNIKPDDIYKVTDNKRFSELYFGGLHLTNDFFKKQKVYASCDYLDLSDNPALTFRDGLIKYLNIRDKEHDGGLNLAMDNVTDADIPYILSELPTSSPYHNQIGRHINDLGLSSTYVTDKLSTIIAKAKQSISFLEIDNTPITFKGINKLIDNQEVDQVVYNGDLYPGFGIQPNKKRQSELLKQHPLMRSSK